MRTRSRVGVVMVLVGLALVHACGFDGVASRDLGDRQDAAGDGPPTTTSDGSLDAPVVNDASADADADATSDSGVRCQDVCTSGTCVLGVCQITCVGACAQKPKCPAGVPCLVTCTGSSSCAAGVDCGDATECTVICSGIQACDGPIDCTGGAPPNKPPKTARCTVSCTTPKACSSSIVANATTTSVTCVGMDACNAVTCGGGVCSVQCNIVGCNDPPSCCATTCVGVTKTTCP